MAAPESHAPEVENRNHRYVGNRIPWFVHLLWVSFWLLALYYGLRYLLPAIQREFLTPPP
jgi:hypothetical protein